MRCRSFALLLVLFTLTTFAAELPAQNPTPASIARQRFNQVFVKVIMPVTARTPKQDGPVVESWVAEQLKELGESEYFAVTDWVPVCDGLLEDDEVDNRVWSGSLVGKNSVAFALSAATFLNAKMAVCWFSLVAGIQAGDTRRRSHWWMNLALEPLSRCCLILPAEKERRFRGKSRWLMWPS